MNNCCPQSKSIYEHLKCRNKECPCLCHQGRALFRGPKFEKEKTRVFVGTNEKPYIELYRLENEDGLGPFRRDPRENDGLCFEQSKIAKTLYKRKAHLAIFNLGPDEVFEEEKLIKFDFFKKWIRVKSSKENKTYDVYHNAFKYATENKDDLNKWFSKREQKILKRYGYRPVKVRACLALMTSIQVVYIPYKKDEHKNGLISYAFSD